MHHHYLPTIFDYFFQTLLWPDKDKARRIVVFVTDATPHIAGDGKVRILKY